MADKSTTNLITSLEEFFKKAPVLPPNVREIIVRFTPILSLVFGVLGIITGALGLLSLTIFAPLAVMLNRYSGGYGNGFIATLTLLVSSILLLMAYPGVKARKIHGWEMLFWSEAATIVGSIIQLDIVSALLSALIGFYILFQVKSYYK